MSEIYRQYESAAAQCADAGGLLELAGASGNSYYRETAERIVTSLCENYMSPDESEALLDHAAYTVPGNEGVDEACIWGDYYFAEALSRLCDGKNFVRFW